MKLMTEARKALIARYEERGSYRKPRSLQVRMGPGP